MQYFRGIVLCLFAFLLLFGVCNRAHAQRSRSDDDPLADAIARLTAEARAMIADERLPPASPDFAGRFIRSIDANDLLEAILTRAHKNDFIDAYIRWQLTSFNPKLPDLDDRVFAILVNNAPKMVPNPMAHPETVKLFERAKAAQTLSPLDQTRFAEMISRLQTETALARALNEPAMGYRKWIESQLPAAGPRRRQWLLEHCASTIRAGWPTRAIKTKITKEFTASAGDASFTPRQRLLVAEQARTLAGMKRTFINEAAMTARGAVQVSFSTAGVTKKDVEKWADRLLRAAPPPDG